jgi:hypothetical protein
VKVSRLCAFLCLRMVAMAQGLTVSGSGDFSGNGTSSVSGFGQIVPKFAPVPERPVEVGSLQLNLRANPSSSTPPAGLMSLYRGRARGGRTYFSRTVLDGVHHEYFGYEIMLDERQPGTYLATFGKLGVTPMEAETTVGSNWKEWSMRSVSVPDPRVVHDGDLISIELMTDANTGEKLIEDIAIHAAGLAVSSGTSAAAVQASRDFPDVPTVPGIARDFTAADAEMHLARPRVSLNGTQQSTAARGVPNAAGVLVWFYLPGRGRYILSLAPRPALDFQRAGEVRGGSIHFTLGTDTLTLDCEDEVATGNAPYFVYAFHDPAWEPTSDAQKKEFAVGSVSAGELLKLKRP